MSSRPLDGFLEELQSALAELSSHWAIVEQNRSARDDIKESRRLLHNLKGSGGMTGLHRLSRIAAMPESLLEEVLDRGAPLTERRCAAVTELLKSIQQHAAVFQRLSYEPEVTLLRATQIHDRFREHPDEVSTDEPAGNESTGDASIVAMSDRSIAAEPHVNPSDADTSPCQPAESNEVLSVGDSTTAVSIEPNLAHESLGSVDVVELPSASKTAQPIEKLEASEPAAQPVATSWNADALAADMLARMDDLEDDDDLFESASLEARAVLASEPSMSDDSSISPLVHVIDDSDDATEENDDSPESTAPDLSTASIEPPPTGELADLFRGEAEEHLHAMYAAVRSMEQRTGDPREALRQLRRSTHSLKGSAGIAGMGAASRVAHRMEDLLDHWADSHYTPDAPAIRLLYQTTDVLSDLTQSTELTTTTTMLCELEAGYRSLLTPPKATPALEDSLQFTSTEQFETVDADVAALNNAEVDAVNVECDAVNSAAVTEVAPSIEPPDDRASTTSTAIVEPALESSAGAEDGEAATSADVSPRNEWIAPSDDMEVDVDSTSAAAEMLPEVASATISNEAASIAEWPPKSATVDIPASDVAASEQVDPPVRLAPPPASVPVKQTPPTAIEQAKGADGASATPTQFLRVPLERLDALARLNGELLVNRAAFEQRVAQLSQLESDVRQSLARLKRIAQEFDAGYGVDALKIRARFGRFLPSPDGSVDSLPHNERTANLDEFDPLEFDRYTDFHTLSRSLAETTADLTSSMSGMKSLAGDFETLLGRQNRLSRDAQERLLKIRLLPINSIAMRLERAVRAVATSQGKPIEFSIQGGATELDKTVLDGMIDALTHLVRNAADHGIESPEDRIAAGKPATGRIVLSAASQGTHAVITIVDDGRGLDRQGVREALVRSGRIARSDADSLTDAAVDRAIFEPGFSTASRVTEFSGRGVGLDVVRTQVAALKGSVAVSTLPGQSTTVVIRLPLTLSTIRALLVQAAGRTFAVPLGAVQRVARCEPGQMEQLAGAWFLRDASTSIRLHSLADRLGFHSDANWTATPHPVIVISAGGERVALAVDRILAGRDIVVKPLGPHLKRVPGVLGATFLGDGSIAPILDPAALAETDRASSIAGDASIDDIGQTVGSGPADVTPRRKIACVVDDSVTVRKVLAGLLRSHGWDVLEAKDGLDALDVIRDAPRRPDIFLLDVEMPRLDGYELLSSLRSTSEYASTPVVMITSRAGEKHRQKALRLGATEYLVKPFEPEALIALAERLTATVEAASIG